MTRVYCHPCDEWAIETGARKCAWCSTPFGQKKKNPEPLHGMDLFVSEAHKQYLTGKSLLAVARELYKRFGYSSVASCEMSIRREFKRRGIETRSRSEAFLGNQNNRFCKEAV